MDLADDCLAQLDFVVASVHTAFGLEPAAMTDRLLRALECPWVDALGHPTGRMLLRREPLRFDIEAVLRSAAAKAVAIEINSQIYRLDVSDTIARRALELGARLIISSDAHDITEFENLDWGVRTARRAWAAKGAVLTTQPLKALRASLRRNQSRQPRKRAR
jgi:DNA polymerase (family 10)